MFRSLKDWGLAEARVENSALAALLVLALLLIGALFGTAVLAASPSLPVENSQVAPPSLWIEQLGPDGEVTARRDVARLVFSDGTTMDCAALFTTPPARPLGSDVQTIGFEIPSSSLRLVFDLYRP